MTAATALSTLSAALLEVIPTHFPAFAPASTSSAALSAEEEQLLSALAYNNAHERASDAAAWTAQGYTEANGLMGDGMDELELLSAVEQAKNDLLHWRSREAVLEHINDSIDLTSLVAAIHTDPRHPLQASSLPDPWSSDPGGPNFLARVAKRDDLALAHLRSCQRTTALERQRVVVMSQMADLRRDCEILLAEIRRQSDTRLKAAERGLTEDQRGGCEQYKARTKTATARREVARNVLQALIVESGFDWAEDNELKVVMLALGEESGITDKPTEVMPAEPAPPAVEPVRPPTTQRDPDPAPDADPMDV